MTKSGELRWMVSSSRPAYDKNGQLTGILNRLTDITDRKRAEAQKDLLVQADKLAVLGTMVSGVAHEINNPNNFIMLNAPILADIWDGILPILEERYKTQGDFIAGGLNYSEIREEVPKLFYGIKEGAERIKRIVGDLKRFARLEPPDLSQDVDINEVVKSAVSLTNDLLKKATDRFTVEYADNPPKIKGNFQRIEQVVINLLLNACEALTGKNQAITVTTSRMAENVVILVSDEGAGIPEDVLRHMTDPFFTTKKDSGGTGLGLSVASGIVKAHGGSLEFTSTLGKGTAAVVILPIRQGTNS
jgi:C4-dicarboxylate-specific signal transduction histidine kinase